MAAICRPMPITNCNKSGLHLHKTRNRSPANLAGMQPSSGLALDDDAEFSNKLSCQKANRNDRQLKMSGELVWYMLHPHAFFSKNPHNTSKVLESFICCSRANIARHQPHSPSVTSLDTSTKHVLSSALNAPIWKYPNSIWNLLAVHWAEPKQGSAENAHLRLEVCLKNREEYCPSRSPVARTN